MVTVKTISMIITIKDNDIDIRDVRVDRVVQYLFMGWDIIPNSYLECEY